MPGLLPRAGGGDLLWTWPLATFVGYKRETIQMIFLTAQHWHKHKQKNKHKKNGQVCSSCACAYAYVVALTSENGVDISTSISIRLWTNHRPLWPRPHCEHIKSNMADKASAILFIIDLIWAGIENWVKYAILCLCMSLYLCLCTSENQALKATDKAIYSDSIGQSMLSWRTYTNQQEPCSLVLL